ncbi:hypothetical protein E2C01_053947 [Portunus trituberculatus]|uniref:Uncharacterized protein n=1 Tax=Portunus trituberculatus TaxID=210409 RepID=A0A5B7GQP3_PORTR|nr:hypothetical protein [Portunus trituberculatus]
MKKNGMEKIVERRNFSSCKASSVCVRYTAGDVFPPTSRRGEVYRRETCEVKDCLTDTIIPITKAKKLSLLSRVGELASHTRLQPLQTCTAFNLLLGPQVTSRRIHRLLGNDTISSADPEEEEEKAARHSR